MESGVMVHTVTNIILKEHWPVILTHSLRKLRPLLWRPFCRHSWYSFETLLCPCCQSLHPVSSCRSQPLHSGLGAEEEWEPVPPASRSWLLNVRHQEAAEQGHSLHSCPPRQEVPWQPEAQTVPGVGSTGRTVCWGQTGELFWNKVCVAWTD